MRNGTREIEKEGAANENTLCGAFFEWIIVINSSLNAFFFGHFLNTKHTMINACWISLSPMWPIFWWNVLFSFSLVLFYIPISPAILSNRLSFYTFYVILLQVCLCWLFSVHIEAVASSFCSFIVQLSSIGKCEDFWRRCVLIFIAILVLY